MNKPLITLVATHMPEDMEAVIMHDWWIALVASAMGKIYLFDEPTVDYRQHSNNALGAKDRASIEYIIDRGMSLADVKTKLDATVRQAGVFEASYKGLISAIVLRIIHAYGTIKDCYRFRRCAVLRQYKIWKQGPNESVIKLFEMLLI